MKFLKNWLLKRRIKQTLKMLEKIDRAMISLKLPRWKRRQIWRDFIKSRKRRLQMTDYLKD